MRKQKKRFEVDFYLNWSRASVSKIREDLDAMEKLGVTNVDMDAYIDSCGSADLSFEVYTYREETDKEFENRVEETRDREQRLRDKDVDEFERLKLKLNK